MFQSTKTSLIEKELSKAARQLMHASPGIKVMAARRFLYGAELKNLRIAYSTLKPFNVIEEFIIRLCLSKPGLLDMKDLIRILGINAMLMEPLVGNLVAEDVLQFDQTGKLSVTDNGEQYFTTGQFPQRKFRDGRILTDPVTGSCEVFMDESHPSNGDYKDDLPFLEAFLDAGIDDAENGPEVEREIKTALREHLKMENLKVLKYEIRDLDDTIFRSVPCFLIYDSIDDKVTIRAGIEKILPISRTLTESLERGNIDLKEMFEFPDDDIIHREPEGESDSIEVETPDVTMAEDDFFLNVRKHLTERFREMRKEAEQLHISKAPSGSPPIILLRNNDIRRRFFKELQEAQDRIIIYSPWMTAMVVDEKFIEILRRIIARNVWVLIGYGIARSPDRETRLPEPELLEKLRALTSSDGIPRVHAHWIGNLHNKEVLIDMKSHILGSFNFLSYRGDYAIRDESVYLIQDPAIVQSAFQHLKDRFTQLADRLWQQGIQNKDFPACRSALCIRSALHEELPEQNTIENLHWEELDMFTGRLQKAAIHD